ncbi:MAG: M50 family metallopeptidase [Melioribacteraceae bacterium]|jgi:hypothetical protein|nr:M50 family metallopeptidase [Melioribacteraceae bacterium]
MKLKLNKKQKSLLELSLLIVIPILTFLLWENPVLYPIKIFSVLMHEISHGLAAIFTGGYVLELNLSEYLGGSLISSGGNQFVIASSGYLGSLLFGSILYISSFHTNFFRWLSVFIGTILLLFTANFIKGTFGAVFGIIYSFIFLALPFIKNEYFVKITTRILAMVSIIYVFTDIKEDLLTLTYRETDAQLLFELTGIKAWIWGLSWFLLTAAAIYFLVRYSIKNK